MSKSQAIAFFEKISKNNKLAQEVEKVVGGKDSDETKAKELLSLAKDHGFNFTKEEAARAQGALKTSLSPEEMLEVSGGKLNLKSSVMAAAMLIGLGVGGAALHNMEASAMKRRAPSDFNGSRGSGKRGKMDQSNGDTQQTPQQTQHATTETTNSTQNETPPSNSQGMLLDTNQHTSEPPLLFVYFHCLPIISSTLLNLSSCASKACAAIR